LRPTSKCAALTLAQTNIFLQNEAAWPYPKHKIEGYCISLPCSFIRVFLSLQVALLQFGHIQSLAKRHRQTSESLKFYKVQRAALVAGLAAIFCIIELHLNSLNVLTRLLSDYSYSSFD
jgi:hypothetical protein